MLASAVLIALLVAGLAPAPEAEALPSVGALPQAAAVADLDGKPVSPNQFAGRPVLIIYESRASSRQNAPLKDALNRLAVQGKHRGEVVVMPIAFLARYNSWPLRTLVRRGIRRESDRIGMPIYSDWTGAFASAYGLSPELSSIILIGRSGLVLFASEGPLSDAERQRLIGLLRVEVGT